MCLHALSLLHSAPLTAHRRSAPRSDGSGRDGSGRVRTLQVSLHRAGRTQRSDTRTQSRHAQRHSGSAGAWTRNQRLLILITSCSALVPPRSSSRSVQSHRWSEADCVRGRHALLHSSDRVSHDLRHSLEAEDHPLADGNARPPDGRHHSANPLQAAGGRHRSHPSVRATRTLANMRWGWKRNRRMGKSSAGDLRFSRAVPPDLHLLLRSQDSGPELRSWHGACTEAMLSSVTVFAWLQSRLSEAQRAYSIAVCCRRVPFFDCRMSAFCRRSPTRRSRGE